MADISDTLKSILGDGGEDKLKGLISSLSGGGENTGGGGGTGLGVDADSMASLMQLRGIADSLAKNRSNPSTNLLLSLKPFMRDGRRKSIDSAVKLMGMLNIMQMLGN